MAFASEMLAEVGFALRRPVQFTLTRQQKFPVEALIGLGISAVLGVAIYGLTFGLGAGPGSMLWSAARSVVAAGTAWLCCLPALYVAASVGGSKLTARDVAIPALVTMSFGGVAMLASVPVTFVLAGILREAHETRLIPAVHFVVFGGVGMTLCDVFLRCYWALEPRRFSLAPWFWLLLMGVMGGELFATFKLFEVLP